MASDESYIARLRALLDVLPETHESAREIAAALRNVLTEPRLETVGADSLAAGILGWLEGYQENPGFRAEVSA